MTEPVTSFKLEAPGGLINIEARVQGGRVIEVKMRSMPAFVGKVMAQLSSPESFQLYKT